MRKSAGWIVAVLGTAGLGWWAQTHHAKDIEAHITNAALNVAQTSIQGITPRVSGRDITLTGLADSKAEFDAITGQMDAIPGRRVVTANLRILPVASPYTFGAGKSDEGPITDVQGVIPTTGDAASLLAMLPDADLEVAQGAPANWMTAISGGLEALHPLTTGHLTLTDRAVHVTGVAQSAVELERMNAALAALPDGFTATSDVDLIDDGTPARYAMRYDATQGAVFTGTMPGGTNGMDLGARLGVATITDTSSPDIAPDAVAAADTAQITAMIDAIAPHMPQIETMDIAVRGAEPNGPDIAPIGVDIALSPGYGTDGDALAQAIRSALPGDAGRVAVTLAAPEPAPTDATERLHQITGAAEYLIDGTWVGLQSPYVFDAVKTGAATTITGMIPSAQARDEIATVAGAQADTLTPAHGAPDGWSATVIAGMNALAPLTEGTLAIRDQQVTLTGAAATPSHADQVDQALLAMPKPFAVTRQIDTLDDGLPADYSLSYTSGDGVRVEGRLPQGMTADTIASALGLDAVTSTATQDLSDPATADVTYGTSLLTGFGPWMPQIETLHIDVTGAEGDTPPTASADVTMIAGTDIDAVNAAILGALPEGQELAMGIVVNAPATPAEGTTRVNDVTGTPERLSNGYWLPVRDFTPDAATCAELSDQVLRDEQIEFISGSAQLTEAAAQSVNALASVIGPCVAANLMGELGGHTDSTGSAELNQTLSQERADAVRAALMLRGIPEAGLTAKGYGASKPIADNSTEDGRAANRRTEIIWTAAPGADSE